MEVSYLEQFSISSLEPPSFCYLKNFVFPFYIIFSTNNILVCLEELFAGLRYNCPNKFFSWVLHPSGLHILCRASFLLITKGTFNIKSRTFVFFIDILTIRNLATCILLFQKFYCFSFKKFPFHLFNFTDRKINFIAVFCQFSNDFYTLEKTLPVTHVAPPY